MVETALVAMGRRVRRNHALEHATIHLLSANQADVPLRGRSNRKGFYIAGDVPTEAIAQAASEALGRLKAGESGLAIHPFCGTNLAVAGLMAGTASGITARSVRKGEALPVSILTALIALIISQPMGMWVQRCLTTDSNIGDMRIVSIRPKRFFGKRVHFVETAD